MGATLSSRATNCSRSSRAPSANSAKCHVPLDGSDEDEADESCLELKQNLPDDLKAYSNSIQTLFRFWCTEIETLSQTDYKEAAVLFYMNVFKLIPEARHCFAAKNIELQAKQFFGMFRWIITNLSQPDSNRLVSHIKLLGAMHAKMHIKPEWYTSFLWVFHETMSETFGNKYTARIRFCMEQMYTVVMNIMLDRDFESLSSAKIANIINSLDKLDHCLQDKDGNVYLEMYMRQQFCVELMLFYQDHRRFKSCVSDIQRQKRGTEMVRKYIDRSAECEINVSHDTILRVHASLQANKGVFVEDVFDECIEECIELIRVNVWDKFKRSITKMVVDHDLQLSVQRSASPWSPISPSISSSPMYSAAYATAAVQL